MTAFDPNCRHEGIEWEGSYGCDSCHYCPKCYGSKEEALEKQNARLRSAAQRLLDALDGVVWQSYTEEAVLATGMLIDALVSTSARRDDE